MSDPRQDNYKARRTHKNTAKDSYKARKNTQKYSYRVPKKRIATKLGHTKNPAAGCLKKIATKLQSWKDKVHQHDCILTKFKLVQFQQIQAKLNLCQVVHSIKQNLQHCANTGCHCSKVQIFNNSPLVFSTKILQLSFTSKKDWLLTWPFPLVPA